MPRGMGQLKNLKTLSLFVICDKESDHGQLDELKELDIRGYLEIRNLESVSDASIAGGISMSNKSGINELELYWNVDTNNNEKKTRHEKIGEALEVSTKCLKRLKMSGYKGLNMPKWVGESSASLVELHLEEMDNVQHIFTMNNMINTIGEIGMQVLLFPLLKELHIKGMKNLRELVSPDTISTRAFPNLSSIRISRCPSLGALPPPPCLKSLQDVVVWGECSDELLQSISNMRNLINISVWNMRERSVLFPGGANNNNNNNDDEASPLLMMDEITSPSSSSSSLAADNNIEAQAGGPSITYNFQSLRRLEIKYCRKLRSLFDEECEELAAAEEGGQRELREIRTRGAGGGGGLITCTNLTHLDIWGCPELRISVEQWRNLLITPSLQQLWIIDCPKLVPSSKEEEAAEVMALVRSLGRNKSLWIFEPTDESLSPLDLLLK